MTTNNIIPCECWEGSGAGDMTGAEYCIRCGAKRSREMADAHKEAARGLSFTQSVALEVNAKMKIRREKQRIVNTQTTDCTKADCVWYSPGRDRNCYRDPGDCRYS